MKASSFKVSLLVTCILLLCGVSWAQQQGQHLPQQQHFETMSDYLSRGSGKWKGENPRYNSDNPRSPKAFGLWFERPLKYLLTLKIVAYQKDTTIISSQGVFSWHPQKKQFVHSMSDRGNGYSEGISEFPNDSTFISTMINYRPNGRTFDHKDENFKVSEDVHRNTSYSKDESGNWQEQGQWTWIREPEE